VETTRSAIGEFIATFAVVLVAAGATITGGFGLDSTGIALAYGAAFAAAIAATDGGRGQANPAITIGLWVAGRIETFRGVVIVVAQVAGAVLAALLLRYVNPGTAFTAAAGGTPVVASGTAVGKAIVIEAVATFLVVSVYFATIVDTRALRRGLGPLWTGLMLIALVLVFGPYTGVAVNPARWFGPALASATWANWEVWLVGPISGAIIASVVWTALFLHDDELVTP